VGLMLIERLVLHEGSASCYSRPRIRRRRLGASLARMLPIWWGLISATSPYLVTRPHQGGRFPRALRRIAELADGRSHRRGTFPQSRRRGDALDGGDPSRYYRLYDLLDSAERPRRSICSRLHRSTPSERLPAHGRAFYAARRDVLRPDARVNNFRAHFNNMEKALRKLVGSDAATSPSTDELSKSWGRRDLPAARGQRSRAYARRARFARRGMRRFFRSVGHRRSRSIHPEDYGQLLDMFEKAFKKASPLFTLACTTAGLG